MLQTLGRLKACVYIEGRERNKADSSKILLLGDSLYVHTCPRYTHLLGRWRGQEALTKHETDRTHIKFSETALQF